MLTRWTPNNESRYGAPILWAVIHTNEGPNNQGAAMSLAQWMETHDVSYHVVLDDQVDIQLVPDSMASWAILNGNKYALNLCFVGYSAWDRTEWLRHDPMLQRGAKIVRSWCDLYKLSTDRLSVGQVQSHAKGIIGHVDYTNAIEGSHTDPGNGFPWDKFIGYVKGVDDVSADDVWHGVLVTNSYGQQVHAIDIINATEAKLDKVLAALDHLLQRLEETAKGIITGYVGTLDTIKKDTDPIKAELDTVLQAVLQAQAEIVALASTIKTGTPLIQPTAATITTTTVTPPTT